MCCCTQVQLYASPGKACIGIIELRKCRLRNFLSCERVFQLMSNRTTLSHEVYRKIKSKIKLYDGGPPLNKGKLKLNDHNTVKPVLTTTFLKRPPVLNDHVVVLP